MDMYINWYLYAGLCTSELMGLRLNLAVETDVSQCGGIISRRGGSLPG